MDGWVEEEMNTPGDDAGGALSLLKNPGIPGLEALRSAVLSGPQPAFTRQIWSPISPGRC